MKISFYFLLFIFILTFSEAHAQKSDSASTTLLMKRKSQIFMAEIETKLGIQKGILYEADSSGIVILDSLYQRVSISLNEMKSLKIYRSNAALLGAKIGFFIPFIPFNVLGIVFFVSSGTIANGFTAGLFFIGLAGGIICGISLAILNQLIPHTIIRNSTDFSETYQTKLRYFKLATQQNLIQRHPNKTRLVYNNLIP